MASCGSALLDVVTWSTGAVLFRGQVIDQLYEGAARLRAAALKDEEELRKALDAAKAELLTKSFAPSSKDKQQRADLSPEERAARRKTVANAPPSDYYVPSAIRIRIPELSEGCSGQGHRWLSDAFVIRFESSESTPIVVILGIR